MEKVPQKYVINYSASMKFIVFWAVAQCSHVEVDRRFRDAYCISVMMEAVRISETSVSLNVTTRRYVPRRL
jgi:hypothetical protein